MITFFNRKELIVTNDMRLQSEIYEVLRANGIACIIDDKGSATRSSERRMIGTFGQDLKYQHEYHIYVHKKDYDSANYLIRTVK